MIAEANQVETPMGRPKSRGKTQNIKLAAASHEAARIAAGYTGEHLIDYLSRIVKREAEKDIEKYHAQRVEKIKEDQPEDAN